MPRQPRFTIGVLETLAQSAHAPFTHPLGQVFPKLQASQSASREHRPPLAEKQRPLVQSLKQHWLGSVQEPPRSWQPPQNSSMQASPPQQGCLTLQDRPRQGPQVPPPTAKSHASEQQLS